MARNKQKRHIEVSKSVTVANRKVAIELALTGYAISFANSDKECIVTGWQDSDEQDAIDAADEARIS